MRVLVAALALLAGAPSRADATHAALRAEAARLAAESQAPVLDRAAFLAEPSIGQVRLAPDGAALAFARRHGAHAEVLLQDVATGARTRLVAETNDVALAWSGDGRRLWIADAAGLAVAEAATRSAKRVLAWDGRRAQRFWRVDAGAPRHAIVEERTASDGWRYVLVDASGATRTLHEAAQPLRDVLLDAHGALRYSAAYDGPGWDVAIRRHGPDGVRELRRCAALEECRLAGHGDGALWILSRHGDDTRALQRWRADTRRWDTVHRDPAGVADAESVLWDATRSTWRAVAYYRERRHWVGHGARDAARLDALQRRLPGASLDVSTSTDGATWLVRAQRADRLVDAHFLHVPATGALAPLLADEDAAVGAPPPEHLARLLPFDWRAADGMTLHGYVALPRGVDVAKAPLVAWLHGGPVARNDDAWHPAAQLLANRGCVVFLPDFRGSSGYGLAYQRAARGDVGDGRVLADVLDGLDALLALGVGARDRQAVMGHSFGGYASLLAASHRPDRFRVAFAAAPPTDYGWTKQWQAEHDSVALRGDGAPAAVAFVQHGFPFGDPGWRARMRRESPLAAVARLRTPVYLWAGAKDDRVPLKSVANYVAEAKRHGRTLQLLVDPEAGHAPRTPLGADAWLHLVERAAHAAFGTVPTPPSPALAAFLRANATAPGEGETMRERP